MVDVWVPYGRTEVCVRIPTRNYLGEAKPKEATKPSDINEEIRNGVRSPVGSDSLKIISEGKKNASIVIDSSLSPELSEKITSEVISELIERGVSESDISVIVGCGLNPVGQKFIESFSEDFRNLISIHNCYSEDHVDIGKTRYGTKISVNRVFFEADLKILVGGVSLHPFAGFSGGRYLVLPGVCGARSIKKNHALLIRKGAKPGILNDNPVHEDMMEAAKMVGVDYCVNVVLNDSGDLIKIFSGDIEESFHKTVEYVREYIVAPVERKAEIVVVGVGGYPKDSTLSNAVDALVYASNSVKKGGSILLIAECMEGYGNKTFYEWMIRFKNLKEVEKAIKRNFEYGGEKAYYLLKMKELADLKLISTLPNFYSESVFKLKTSRAANKALRETLQDAGKGAKILAIPKALHTLPTLSNET